MKLLVHAGLSACIAATAICVPSGSWAQAILPNAPVAPEAGSTLITVPTPLLARNTMVLISIGAPLSSRTSHIGDHFPITLAEPIVDVSGKILLRTGTAGEGEVVHAAKAGFGGKPGEMILAARFLQCADLRIPLGHFHFAATGSDQSNMSGGVNAAAAGAAVLAPVAAVGSILAFMITGGEIAIPVGTRAQARITADTAMTQEAVAACGG